MPRGVKKTIEDQISEIDQKIQELQEKKKAQISDTDRKIQEFQEKKKQLLEEKDQEAIRQLLDAAKETGITPAELVKQLAEQKKSEDNLS